MYLWDVTADWLCQECSALHSSQDMAKYVYAGVKAQKPS